LHFPVFGLFCCCCKVVVVGSFFFGNHKNFDVTKKEKAYLLVLNLLEESFSKSVIIAG